MATLSAAAKAKWEAWLGVGSGQKRIDVVLEVSPVRFSDSATVTLYASAYGYRNATGESLPRLELPSGISLSVLNQSFGREREDGSIDLDVFGVARISTGSFRILNADSVMDDWRTLYSWGDAVGTFLIGYMDDDYSDFEPFWPFLIEKDPAGSRKVLEFTTKAAVLNMNAPGQSTLFATPTELEGTPKPVWLGENYSVGPPRVGGSATPQYLLNAGGMNSIDKGYEGGTPDTTAHSGYSETLGTGLATLGNEPLGDVTFDGKGEKFDGGSYSDLQAKIIDYLLTRESFTGLPAGDISDFATDTGSPNSGIYFTDWRIGQAINWMRGPRAIFFPDQDGLTPRLAVIKNPSGESSTETYAGNSIGTKPQDGAHIKDIRIRSASPPVYHVSLGYQELWHKPGELFVEDAAEIARQSEDRQYATAIDATILTDYPGAKILWAKSPLTDATEAATEAASILALFKVPRVVIEVDLVNKFFHSWVGDYVTLKFDRYGLDAGLKFLVVGFKMSLAPGSRKFTLILWGEEP